MIDNMAKLIRTKAIGCKSERMIKECIKYVVGEDGDTNAASGNDDTVTSSAIILLVMDSYITELVEIHAPVKSTEEQHTFVLQPNGSVKHVSEIEDEARRGGKDADDDANWFRRNGW
jgi:hypothetical protein